MVYLNLLWFFFTILGLGIFGIGPATGALFKIQDEWLEGKSPTSIFTTYAEYYKKYFKKMNKMIFVLATIGLILYFDIRFFAFQDGLHFELLTGLMYFFTFWYLVLIVYSFPVSIKYDLSMKQHVKYCFSIALLNPLRTIALIISAISILVFSLYYPLFLLTVGISITSLILIYLSNRTFDQIFLLKKRLQLSSDKQN